MAEERKLSHINERKEPEMVDISHKEKSQRKAIARAIFRVGEEIMSTLAEGQFNTKKGSVIQTAIIAAQMAVKQTSNLIPLCHPLALTGTKVTVEPLDESRFQILCSVKTLDRTGVEMEALTGASVAALTMYDMIKALSHDLVIEEVRLMEKSGGKSDFRLEE
jgi:cyclic pyranopterin phosphate synthase